MAFYYPNPGMPRHGSLDWGAARILQLLEDDEHRRRNALASPLYDHDYQAPAVHLVDAADWTVGGAAIGGTLGAIAGGIVGGVGGGVACTPVAPGVGTVVCGSAGLAEGALVGGGLGAGLGGAVGSAIGALTSDEEKEREEFCERRYAEEVEVCNMFARRKDKRRAAACFASANERLANCLRGKPLPPLAGWNRQIDGF